MQVTPLQKIQDISENSNESVSTREISIALRILNESILIYHPSSPEIMLILNII